MSRLIQSERDGSIPVAEALTDLPNPRLRLAITSLASIGWTSLVGAREAAPDTGFMARMMGLCSLHHHLEFRVLAEAAHADIADVVTGPPVLSGKTL